MAEGLVVNVDPGQKLRDALKEAQVKVGNLTIPLTLISKMWFKSNQAIFKLKGKGKYEDLTERYKLAKERAGFSVYPILKRSGLLEKAITNPKDQNAFNLIVNQRTLIMGVQDSGIPYAKWLQDGWRARNGRQVPRRPYVLIGAEQTGPDEFNERMDAYVKVIEDYVKQVWDQVSPKGRG